MILEWICWSIPEQHQVGLKNIPKIVVPVYGSSRIIGYVSKHLHPDDGVDKEEHHHQHHNVWKSLDVSSLLWALKLFKAYLDWLNKGVEEYSNTDGPSEKLDKSSCSKQSQKANFDYTSSIDDTAGNRDKVEGVPSIFEIWLR